MFTVKSCYEGLYCIVNQQTDYLHSNGGILQTPEYWPTKELAQAVLDKYQPKHVWVHGDIAVSHAGGQRLFVNVDGKLTIFDKFGGILSSLTNTQQWADQFGYKKIGNMFGFGL